MAPPSLFLEELEPYNVTDALRRDASNDCVVFNVGQDHNGQRAKSLEHIEREVDQYLIPEAQRLNAATKLYIVGEWVCSARNGNLIVDGTNISFQEVEWKACVDKIIPVIQSIPNLREFTWMTTLPFMEAVWAVLPKTLTKLVLTLDNPIRVDSFDDNRPTYISHEAMKPLVTFTKLEQLRLFGMRDSFQSIIWETVYRNDADTKSMQVLDLSMKLVPLVRQNDWLKAADVKKLTVAYDEIQPYKGIDGKGILHYERGTGEYLDDLCIRHARNASNIDTTKALPLWCLKLDGFVVDHLPFKHELNKIVLLVCGENCIDAGLRAPKTAHPHNKWRDWVKNTMTHCAIKFPNWTGVFDAEGYEHDVEGNVISYEEARGRSPEQAPQSPIPLETLSLENSDRQTDSSPRPILAALQSLDGQMPDRSGSAISQRGSPVPTPDAGVDLAPTPDTAVDLASPTASFSSYDDVGADVAADDSKTVGSLTPAKEKQRRSWQFWARKSTNSNKTE